MLKKIMKACLSILLVYPCLGHTMNKKSIIEQLFTQNFLDLPWDEVDKKTINKIVHNKININMRDSNEQCLLYYYISNIANSAYNKKNVELLLKNGACSNFWEASTHNTPLHLLYKHYYTAETIHPGLIALLKKYGAKTIRLNKNGLKPYELKINLPPILWTQAYLQDPGILTYISKTPNLYGLKDQHYNFTLPMAIICSTKFFYGYDQPNSLINTMLKKLLTPETINLQSSENGTFLDYFLNAYSISLYKNQSHMAELFNIFEHAMLQGANFSLDFRNIIGHLTIVANLCVHSEHESELFTNFYKYLGKNIRGTSEILFFFRKILKGKLTTNTLQLLHSIIRDSDVNYSGTWNQSFLNVVLENTNTNTDFFCFDLIKIIITNGLALENQSFLPLSPTCQSYDIIEYLIQSGIRVDEKRPNNVPLFYDKKINFLISKIQSYEVCTNNEERLYLWLQDHVLLHPIIFHRSLAHKNIRTALFIRTIAGYYQGSLHYCLRYIADNNIFVVLLKLLKKLDCNPSLVLYYMIHTNRAALKRISDTLNEADIQEYYARAKKKGHKQFCRKIYHYFVISHLLMLIGNNNQTIGNDSGQKIMSYLGEN